jgi:hypothetical protein
VSGIPFPVGAALVIEAHIRKYGDRRSYVFPVWNGIFEHRARIDDALWVFLWCIDAVTRERDSIGIVYGGAPVKIRQIAKVLRFSRRTVERHLEILEAEKYITRTRTPYGYVIYLSKSLKFGVWRGRKRYDKNVASPLGEIRQEGPRDTTNLSQRYDKNVVNKEDTAIDLQQKDLTQNLPSKLKATPKPGPKRDRFGTILAHQGQS